MCLSFTSFNQFIYIFFNVLFPLLNKVISIQFTQNNLYKKDKTETHFLDRRLLKELNFCNYCCEIHTTFFFWFILLKVIHVYLNALRVACIL